MTDTYLVIQTLGFATGTVLFIVLALLTWKANRVPVLIQANSNSGLFASVAALLWNLSSLTKYALTLCGFRPPSLPLGLANALAYSALASLPTVLLMLVASGRTHPWRSRANRWFRNLSYAVTISMPPAFFTAVLTHNSFLEFGALAKLSAYNLGLHAVAGFFLFRHTQQSPAAHRYARAVLAVLAVLSASLLALIYVVKPGWLATAINATVQQSSIVIALITFGFLSRLRFADIFVKTALLILTSVVAAFCYGLFIVAPLAGLAQAASPRPTAAASVVTTLLWCGLLLLFPRLGRELFRLADRWLFHRPDYQEALRQFLRASEGAENETQLRVLAEESIRQALDAKLVAVVERERIQISDDGINSDLIYLPDDHPARQSFVEGEVEFLVPVRAGEKTTHLVAIALGEARRKLLSDEMAFLSSMAERIGRRIEAFEFERERRERQLREARLRQSLTEAELRALQAQINPHFLFNTLNTIADLIGSEAEKAEMMTERLAEVFRYVLACTERKAVSVGEEFEFLKAYLEIEQARFGRRLKVEVMIDPAVAGQQIPPLILQPLVENAVKHGLSPKREGGRISLRAEGAAGTDSDVMQLTVEDDGVGWGQSQSAGGAGIGLKNVRDRLQTFYEGRAELVINSEAGRGALIRIDIPMQSQPDETQDSDHRRRSLSAIEVEETARRAP